MNGYEEKIKDRLFLEVCNAAGREEWDGLSCISPKSYFFKRGDLMLILYRRR